MNNLVVEGSRLAEFFVVIGLSDEFNFSTLMKSENGRSNSYDNDPKEKTRTKSSSSSIILDYGTKLESCVFNASILDKYGSEENTFPDGIEMFSFPSGLALTAGNTLPKFHSFVHTSESGKRLYGCCLTLYEKITKIQISRIIELSGGDIFNESDFKGIYVPKCICIISYWTFIDSFRSFLCELYRLSCTPSDLPIERYICNFIDDVPAPPAGKININFYICNKNIEFKCPPLNQPTAWGNVPIDYLL
jgi:hypothetical protein